MGNKVLTEKQLKNLVSYKYKVENNSLVEPLLLNFWFWALDFVPMTMASMVLTIFGVLVNIIPNAVLMFYSPDAKSEVPATWLILSAIGLFVHQTLDNIDGKHAKRTGTESPVEEFYDHACDAVSSVFLTIGLGIALKLGTHPDLMFWGVLSGILLVFVAQWQVYVTGIFTIRSLDVTEAQFGIMLFHFTTAFLGSGIWEAQTPLGIPLKTVAVVSSVLMAGPTLLLHISNVIKQEFQRKATDDKHRTDNLVPLLPIAFILVMIFTIKTSSTEKIFENNPCLFLMTFGLCIVKLIHKLVIVHLTKSRMPILDIALLGPVLTLLNQKWGYVIDEYVLLWICLALIMTNILRYFHLVNRDMCSYLNIKCLILEPVAQNEQITDNKKK